VVSGKINNRLGEQVGLQEIPLYRGIAGVCRVPLVAMLLSMLAFHAAARALPPDPYAELQASAPASQLTTLRGIVKNAATGEPLPRALVRLEGDANSGALTDGDGRFEIPNVPVGPQAITVQKPGFIDLIRAGGFEEDGFAQRASFSDHSVRIVPDMPDLVFAMAPTNAIHGQIQLSSGDPAQGVSVMLLRRSVQDGRAVWQIAGSAKSNSDGVYRFATLADGAYAIYTDPTMDNEPATNLVEPGSEVKVARYGYASVFYPDARDLAGSAKIQLAGGQQGQANLSLTMEPFQMVRATVALPGATQSAAQKMARGNYTVSVLDPQGHLLPYGVRGDVANEPFQTYLPDGSYTLLGTSFGQGSLYRLDGPSARNVAADAGPMVGEADFSVAGHPLNVRVSLAPQVANPLQVTIVHNSQSSSASGTQGQSISVTLSQAGGPITDGMVSTYAEGVVGGSVQTNFMGPGTYWVHTGILQKGLCEASFTAGGTSLAREPLVVGPSGATAPLTLSLRDDCASLQLSLPANAALSTAGEEPFYTVYVVPDFDFTVDVTPVTLRASSGGTFTVAGLTPGSYHVYTFAGPVDFEYRNPTALSSLPVPGQAVTLSPGATENLVVEVPAQ